MKKIRDAMMMLAGAVAVHVGVTACSGGDGPAHADTAKTATCKSANEVVRVDLAGLAASDIIQGFAYGAVDAQSFPGAVYIQRQIIAGDGVAYVECASPGTITVAVP